TCWPASGKRAAGFVRSPKGKFHKFSWNAGDTYAVAISRQVVAGDEYDTVQYHGIVRAPDNTVTKFDPSGLKGTLSRSVDAHGTTPASSWTPAAMYTDLFAAPMVPSPRSTRRRPSTPTPKESCAVSLPATTAPAARRTALSVQRTAPSPPSILPA